MMFVLWESILSDLMTFNTVLYNLRSAKNVGMIARSHIAFGGHYLIIIGEQNKWDFKGGTSTYTRKLIELEQVLFFETFEQFYIWNKAHINAQNIAIEISELAKQTNSFNDYNNSNLILGNERTGIPESILKQCDHILTIPQIEAIGSLNVAISASIVLYEASKNLQTQSKIEGFKFV